MWMLLFLQGLLLIIGECNCEGEDVGADSTGDDPFDCTSSLLKCDSYRISLSERIFSQFLIEGPTELRRKCRSIEAYLECMEEATWRCEQVDTTPADRAIIESGEFLRQLCTDHDELKRSFLISTACINKHKAGTYLNCKPDQIKKNMTSFYPSVKASCQYQKALLECRRKSIEKQCGEEVGDFYTRIITLELNLDYLCTDNINTLAPHKFTFDVIEAFIRILIDFIRPILHATGNFYSEKSWASILFDLEEIVSQLWTTPEEKLTESGEDEKNSHSRDSPPEKRQQRMNFNDLRRYGTIPPKAAEKVKYLKARFNDKLEVETLVVLKTFQAALTEFAQFHKAVPEQPVPDVDVVDICDEGDCDLQRSDSSYMEPGDFEYIGTEVDLWSLINDLEAEVGSKYVRRPRSHFIKVENLFRLHENRESKRDEMKINYVLLGQPYIPLEINYSDGNQDYSQHTDVKLFNKKFLLTPSTETVPSMRAEDVIELSKVLTSGVENTGECDTKQKLNLPDEIIVEASKECDVVKEI